MRVSRRYISFSSFSTPEEPLAEVCPLEPCLSNRYVRRFFLSSANPSSKAKRWVSSRRTSCAAIIEAAADSRITREVVSLRPCDVLQSLVNQSINEVTRCNTNRNESRFETGKLLLQNLSRKPRDKFAQSNHAKGI